MSKKIYVGNLSYNTSEDELREIFGKFGTVESASIIIDRETRRSKCFGFVELAEEAGADQAISELDGKEVGGRNLRVNEAISKPSDRGDYRR